MENTMENTSTRYEYLDLVLSRDILKTYIDDNLPNFEIIRVAGDGLCILHAFKECLIASGKNGDMFEIKEKLQNEMSKEIYQTIFPNINVAVEVQKFLLNPLASYDSVVCDMFLSALGNAYKVNIKVYQSNLQEFWVTDLSNDFTSTYYFARSLSVHVDALVPKKLNRTVIKDTATPEIIIIDSEDDELVFVPAKSASLKRRKFSAGYNASFKYKSEKTVDSKVNVKKDYNASSDEDLPRVFKTEKMDSKAYIKEKERRDIIQIDSDDQIIQEPPHSPAVLESFSSEEKEEEVTENTSFTYSRQKKIPRIVWADKPVQDVSLLPYDIDGLAVFKVKAKNRLELFDSVKDGRRWKKDSRTEWSGFVSVRYRDCSGGYSCPNTDCLFYKQFKYGNKTNFKNDGTCEYCSASGDHIWCSARKYTAFSTNEKEAMVYHIGHHNCTAKEISKRPSDIVREAVTKDLSVTPRGIQSASIIADLRSRKNWTEVEKNAKKVANVKALSNEKAKQKKTMEPNGFGFKAVKELKGYTDLQDPLMIHDINDSNQSIFKTSTAQMKVAFEMDYEGNHFLKEEYCHFDGNHKKVKDFVTLTASVYHPLLRKQLVLATMNCKHEDGNYVAYFWRKFNEAFRKVNSTEKKFSPCGWITDMASANFNGLAIVYGEDILTRVKGCEFHFKNSIEKRCKALGTKGEQFKDLALKMLTASTPEAYVEAIDAVKAFASANAEQLIDWIEWWDARKANIFRAFTSFNAPQSNLAEVIHAGWKNRDKMGVSLLECCYFDMRDSILLALSISSIEKGSQQSGCGPSQKDREATKERREIDHAEQLGRDILDFNVLPSSSSAPPSSQKRKATDEGCNPPKHSKNKIKMFKGRVKTARTLENTMKIKKAAKVSALKHEFFILSTQSGRVVYTVTICNVPSCTCPDFKKNGVTVPCKHILFILLFILKRDEEEIFDAGHLGDEDVRAMLTNLIIEDKFKKPDEVPLLARNCTAILMGHELYDQNQALNAKCSGCKVILEVGVLSVKVIGALAVPFGKQKAVEQTFYFCPKRSCFAKAPKWCNVKMPGDTITREEGVEEIDISPV